MEKQIDVMIIGAQKAGTTSLLRYLGEHPSCVVHPQKEFAFFVNPNEYNFEYDKAYQKYFSQNIVSNTKTLIAKSASLFTNEESIKRLYEHNPNCKLIVILRNPTERAYSSYLMEKNYGNTNFDFKQIPDLISNHYDRMDDWGGRFYIDYGLYINHIKLIYKYFSKPQLKIIQYQDFIKNPIITCQEVFYYINVDSSFSPNTDIIYNKTNKTYSLLFAKFVKQFLRNENKIKKTVKKFVPENSVYKIGELLHHINKSKKSYEPMDEKTKIFLQDFFKPYNIELGKLLDQDFSHWNK